MAVEQCRKNGPIWTEDGVRAPDLLAAAATRATASRATSTRARPTGSQVRQRHHSWAPGSSPAGTRRPKPALKGLPRVFVRSFYFFRRRKRHLVRKAGRLLNKSARWGKTASNQTAALSKAAIPQLGVGVLCFVLCCVACCPHARHG